MSIPHQHQSGYSLLEIMMAITILVIITASGIATYRSFEERQRVVAAGRELVVILRDVQKMSQSGNKPDDCPINSTLDGWIFEAVSSQQIRIAASCSDTIISSSESLIDLPQSIILVDDSFRLTFSALTGNLQTTGLGGTPPQIQLNDTSNNFTYSIELTSVGGINDLGINQ